MAGEVGKAIDWAGQHPVTTAVGAFAVGAIILLMLKGGGGGSNNGMAAFYAAQAAQAQSGNALMIAQDQDKTAVALAQTAAAYHAQVATVQSQTDLNLASINAGVANSQELTRQEAQKQQFFLATGIQQIYGAMMPYILNRPDLASIVASSSAAGVTYQPAH